MSGRFGRNQKRKLKRDLLAASKRNKALAVDNRQLEIQVLKAKPLIKEVKLSSGSYYAFLAETYRRGSESATVIELNYSDGRHSFAVQDRELSLLNDEQLKLMCDDVSSYLMRALIRERIKR